MNIKLLLAVYLLLVATSAVVKEQNIKGAPVFELQNSHISRGLTTSISSRFQVKSSVAETVIGTSSNGALSRFVVHSGLLKPNLATELIFLNGFE
jgi:hypothetical protein